MSPLVHYSSISPLRRLGQNFLVNPRIIQGLTDRFDPRPEDRVVEIGPGRGAMTLQLAARAGRYLALELDDRLLPGLQDLLKPFPEARVRTQDALHTDWDALAAEMGGPLRVIGNLPYYAGTAIVRRLLATAAVRDLQVVLQKEVVDRFLASPGTRDYGPLSVIAQLRSLPERLFLISPGSFRPVPKVTSAALRLTLRGDSPLPPEEVRWLEGWLFRGFRHRRKILAGNLAPSQDDVRVFLLTHGFSAQARAETLPPDLWLALARFLEGQPGAPTSIIPAP